MRWKYGSSPAHELSSHGRGDAYGQNHVRLCVGKGYVTHLGQLSLQLRIHRPVQNTSFVFLFCFVFCFCLARRYGKDV